ncbi:uncharacterized protein LOC108913716 [Anoplophora glabripennis]|uniref:uncharacterized protein LOC108913716 n=1 Tax=Anoplophora glabripennis TaxID=217634 RepID=UPI0008744EBD|nr:uncharacterized protein LOC108913716 [Anoplophora glabripennis]
MVRRSAARRSSKRVAELCGRSLCIAAVSVNASLGRETAGICFTDSGAGEEGTMSRSPTPMESDRSSGNEAGDSRPSTPGSIVETTTSRESELAAENARLRQMIDDLRDELRQQRKAFEDLEKRSREQHAELLNALKGQQAPKGVKRGKPGTSSGSEEESCKAKKKPAKANEAPVAEQVKVPEIVPTTSERAAPAEKAERKPPVILRKKEQWSMKSRRNKAPMPLVLVQVPLEQEDLLKVTRCCHLVVRVEPQRARTEPTQCHRCQRFGHAQSRCTADVKCVKCGEGHHSADCTKKRETPAKCANCGGEHLASYRRCSSFPKKTTGSKKQQRKEGPQADKQQAKLAHPPKVTAAKSFADAAMPRQGPAAAPKGGGGLKPTGARNPQMCPACWHKCGRCTPRCRLFFSKMPSLLQE